MASLPVRFPTESTVSACPFRSNVPRSVTAPVSAICSSASNASVAPSSTVTSATATAEAPRRAVPSFSVSAHAPATDPANASVPPPVFTSVPFTALARVSVSPVGTKTSTPSATVTVPPVTVPESVIRPDPVSASVDVASSANARSTTVEPSV